MYGKYKKDGLIGVCNRAVWAAAKDKPTPGFVVVFLAAVGSWYTMKIQIPEPSENLISSQ